MSGLEKSGEAQRSRSFQWPDTELPFDVVTRAVAQAFDLKESALFAHGLHAAVAKATAIELACRYTGLTQCEVAARFGYRSESSVGKQRQRLRIHLDTPEMQKRFTMAESAIRCQATELASPCQATVNAGR